MNALTAIFILLTVVFLIISILFIILYIRKTTICPVCPVCPPMDCSLCPGPNPPPSSSTVTVMTYNILTQNIDAAPTTPECIKWSSRRQRVVEIINSISPDIMALEEINDTSFAYLSQQLTNYQANKGISRGDPANESVAIFYKKGVFDSVTIQSERWTRNMGCGGAGAVKEGTTPRAWTGGEFVKNGKKMFFMGIHMPVKECINLQMEVTQQLVAKINSLSSTYQNIVIAGDFNKGSGSFDMFGAGGISTALPFNTGFVEPTHSNVDACGFWDKGGNLDVIASKTALTGTRVWYFAQPQPNGSDHYPLTAVVSL